MEKIVIIGDGEIAQIAFEYFMSDSKYLVKAFAVEKIYRKREELFGLPVIDLEDIVEKYPKENYSVFVAISFIDLNGVRRRIFEMVKKMGYMCVSYISSKAYCYPDVVLGENVFVFENATIQRGVIIGDNSFIWHGAMVSHRSVIGKNCWIAPACAIAGFSIIRDNCMLGINSTILDNVVISEDTMIGAGAVCLKDIKEKGGIYVGNPARKLAKSVYEFGGFHINS